MQGGQSGRDLRPVARDAAFRPFRSRRSMRKLLKHETWPHAFGTAGYATFAAGKVA
ncbi:hypothetical protein EMGBS6_14630 [Opitutia bacterium]|nr:hypothetical protein EMGBS6_14630 [Opitutae bacterium]